MHSMIGLSAINHGTSWQGLAPILEKLKGMVKYLAFNVDVVTKAAPALQDIMSTSKFVHDLNAHGETLPDVFQANIVTKYVTPLCTFYSFCIIILRSMRTQIIYT